jgi:response regulator of citrate/malate metabolism
MEKNQNCHYRKEAQPLAKDYTKYNRLPSEFRDTRKYSEEELDEMLDLFNNSTRIRKLLKGVFENKLKKSILDGESFARYDNSNWSLKASDNVGYRRALREIIKIILPE